MATKSDDEETGRCWSCDYLLRGVESGRCPECGRGFDRADKATVNWGKIGSLRRSLMRPPTMLLCAIGIVGVGLVVWGTGWPGDWRIRWDRTLIQWDKLPEYWAAGGVAWRAFAIGLAMALIGGGLVLARAAMGWILIASCRLPKDLRGVWRWRLLVTIVSLVFASFWIGAGAVRRWGVLWAGKQLLEQPDARGHVLLANPPVRLVNDEDRIVLRRLLRSGNSKERIVAMKLLIERKMPSTLDLLREAVLDEKDPQVAAAELHLIGLHREASDRELLGRFLSDSRPAVRAAAADVLGIMHDPAYEFPAAAIGLYSGVSLRTDPPIALERLPAFRKREPYPTEFDESGIPKAHYKQVPITPKEHEQLNAMMLDGQSLEEREAAARALLLEPSPGYQLRLAEWGVWLNDEGDLKVMRSVADEIPPFVHRSGNPMAELAPRIRRVVIVTKPVIHVTASETMVVDIAVQILDGRPWFVFPMPDDFAVRVTSKQIRRDTPASRVNNRISPLDQFDAPALGRLDDLRAGYPWVTPSHRFSGSITGEGNPFNEITQVGVHWQSLIVSPKKLSWMAEPPVGDDARFAWWKRLRKVDCSWVSNRGESERFLYYDGPTNLKPPFRFFLEENRLESLVYEPSLPDRLVLGNIGASPGHLEPRRTFVNNDGWIGLFIRVKGKEVTGQVLDQPLGEGTMLHGDEVQQTLVNLIRRRGLTESEAAGFIDCWKSNFFGKPGARVLLLMTQEAYDQFCPITVRPRPTPMVRVGIVVTELK